MLLILPSPLRTKTGMRLVQKGHFQTCRASEDVLPTMSLISFLTTGLLRPQEKSLMGLGLGTLTITVSKLFMNQVNPELKIRYTRFHILEHQRAEKSTEFHWKEIRRYDRVSRH